jgi:hypothetical protein
MPSPGPWPFTLLAKNISGRPVFPSTARTPYEGRDLYPISIPYQAVRIPRYYPYLTVLTTRRSPVSSTMRSLSSDWNLYARANTDNVYQEPTLP